MTMEYNVGDIVRIAHEAKDGHWSAGMLGYLSKAMTIRKVVSDGYYEMEEDDGHWSWFPFMIAGLVSGVNPAPSEPEKPSQQYQVGDRVVITHMMSWGDWADDMKAWLGKTMTIAQTHDTVYYMEEDEGRWSWSPHMIAGLSTSPAPKRYKVGDCVQIASQPQGEYWDEGGQMESWLGQVMTVREVRHDHCYMEEDKNEFEGRGWAWFPWMIAGLEEEFLFEPATDDDFMRLMAQPGEVEKCRRP